MRNARIIESCRVDRVSGDPYQPRRRFDIAAQAELVTSMREHGVIMPIEVRHDPDDPSRFIVIDGERRVRAAKTLGLETIPAMVVEEPLTEAEITTWQLVVNAQRLDLTALEFATAVRTLMASTGMNASQIAAKLGKATSTITRSLALLDLPEDLRQLIEDGKLTPGAATELALIADPAERARLLQGVKDGRLTLTRDGLSRVRRELPSVTGTGGALAPCKSERQPHQDQRTQRLVACLDACRTITFAGSELSTLDQVLACLDELVSKVRKAKGQGLSVGTFLRALRDQAVCAAPGRARAVKFVSTPGGSPSNA